MKLDKKLVDEVIRLTKKYYETNDEIEYAVKTVARELNYPDDTDCLQALAEAKRTLRKTVSWQVVEWQAIDLISDLAKYTQISRNGTYDDIYKALAVFGIIVEEKEKIK